MAPYKSFPPGVYVMHITPFNKNGSIDEGGFLDHLKRMAREKVGAYIAGAGYGEGPAMTEPEIYRLWEIALKEAKGKVPVVAAGHENPNQVRTIKMGKEAKARGMDWYHMYPCTPGHMFMPSKEMFAAYYEAALSQIKMPIVIANNPATGFEVPSEIHEDLIDKYPQIIGFYRNSREAAVSESFIRRVAPRKPVMHSGFSMTAYILGATGELNAPQNLTPRLCRSLHDALIAKDYKKAAPLYGRLQDINTAIRKIGTMNSTLPTIKAALNMMGRPGGYVRPPYVEINDAQKKQLARVLDQFDIKKSENI